MKEYIVHVPKHLETNQEKIVSFFGEPIIELIRCKDCKYYPYGIRLCIDSYKHCKHMTDEGFCSWAVRKETR